MLKLSTKLKTVPFQLDDNGSVVELYASQYTVTDGNKLVAIQQENVLDDDGNIDYGVYVASRVVCSVKRKDTGEHYWNTLEAFTNADYPNELMTELQKVVDELNPVVLSESDDLEQKKSKS